MEAFEQENQSMFDMINRNSKLRNPDLNEALNNFRKICENSKSKETRQYRQKKAKKKQQIKTAIFTATLITTTLISAYTASKITRAAMERDNIIISRDNKYGDEIDNKINYYQNLMNIYSDEQNRIENAYGRNQSTNELNVDYNYSNLAKHIIEASQVSESEMRCVIIAAYNIINSPYREETFDKAFEIAKNNENMSEDTRDLIEKGSKGFLEELQYDNWEEYQKNERQEIKDLKTIEKYSGGKSR